ncbi:hypothetical protein FPV67DRAFT_1681023 [Lyophyllum atratum]|nr:hypothetical protein FPV67DRAFT_1681023 [Lyophyllum atratum]
MPELCVLAKNRSNNSTTSALLLIFVRDHRTHIQEMQRDFDFRVAYDTADDDHREAPWYGVWCWVLENVIFDRDFCRELTGGRTRTTRVYPQFPLTRDIDVNEDEDSYEVSVNDQSSGATNQDLAPSTPTPYSRSRSAPSPEDRANRTNQHSLVGYSPTMLVTPSPPPTHRNAQPEQISPQAQSSIASSPPRRFKTKRSTRIPDFTELLHEYKSGNLQKHILLLVENKAKPIESEVAEPFRFNEVLEQTEDQVWHAFRCHDHDDVDIIGVIVALGPHWRYVEYHRDVVLRNNRGPAGRFWSDGPYTEEEQSDVDDSDEEPETDSEEDQSDVDRSYRDPNAVAMYYDRVLACCSLKTDESNVALYAVRERIQALAQIY